MHHSDQQVSRNNPNTSDCATRNKSCRSQRRCHLAILNYLPQSSFVSWTERGRKEGSRGGDIRLVKRPEEEEEEEIGTAGKEGYDLLHWKVAWTLKQRPTFKRINIYQNIFIWWASAFPAIMKEFLTCGSLWRQSCTFPEFAFSSPVLWMFSIRLLLAKLPDLGARRGLEGEGGVSLLV